MKKIVIIIVAFSLLACNNKKPIYSVLFEYENDLPKNFFGSTMISQKLDFVDSLMYKIEIDHKKLIVSIFNKSEDSIGIIKLIKQSVSGGIYTVYPNETFCRQLLEINKKLRKEEYVQFLKSKNGDTIENMNNLSKTVSKQNDSAAIAEYKDRIDQNVWDFCFLPSIDLKFMGKCSLLLSKNIGNIGFDCFTSETKGLKYFPKQSEIVLGFNTHTICCPVTKLKGMYLIDKRSRISLDSISKFLIRKGNFYSVSSQLVDKVIVYDGLVFDYSEAKTLSDSIVINNAFDFIKENKQQLTKIEVINAR